MRTDAAPPAETDLVVVGGGINGAGIARDAALRGYRVVLLEKYDFGSGSSSRTSKLVHGGVRYLEHGALRLVREACSERRILLRTAPHLVRPLPFVFPVYRDSRFGPWKLRAGMWLYDVLAAFRNVRPHRMLSARHSGAWREGLRGEGLRGAALYYDAAMDDARLVLANVLAARDAGAVTRNRVEVTGVASATAGGLAVDWRDQETGAGGSTRARCVVVSTGPWSNAFLEHIAPGTRPLSTTRGTHIVVRRLAERAFTLAAGRDGRVFFVLPWQERTLVGTTDVVDDDDPARVAPSEAEIDYLIAETNRYFPAANLRRSDVQGAFAGLRPLLRAGGDASARSREHAILEPLPGVLAVAGGKYTTYRAVAESVVDRVGQRLDAHAHCRTAHLPLPGGAIDWTPQEHWDEAPRFMTQARALATSARVPEAIARRWLGTHGTRAAAIATLAADDPRLTAQLCAHAAHLRAEVVHAVRDEMALRLEDWFLRRSRQAFAPCNGLDAVEAVAEIYANELGWSPEKTRSEIEACTAVLTSVACAPPAA